VACLLTAGDGRDEQRALRWKAARKVQERKFASLVHGGGEQELENFVLRAYQPEVEWHTLSLSLLDEKNILRGDLQGQ
jgi:hypothetical protein